MGADCLYQARKIVPLISSMIDCWSCCSHCQTDKMKFKRIIAIIAVIGILMVAGALTYLYLTSGLTTNMVVATTLGVFLSVLLGPQGGLWQAARQARARRRRLLQTLEL